MTTVSGAVGANAWLRVFAPVPQARARLLCFPHAGGAAGLYRPLAAALAPEIELVAVQYPGRQDRFAEPCEDSVAGLAGGVLASLGAFADRPLALFGHSLGATVAFETACALEKSGRVEPTRLFVSARSAPHHARAVDVRLDDDADLIGYVRRLGSANGASLELSEELWPMVLPALRADLRIVNTYRFAGGARLRCPISALAGDADPEYPLAQIRDWAAYTSGGFDLEVLSGGHFYLEQHTTRVAGLVAGRLGPS
ncbi:thioesterase II family protein [Amycolatopsis sp. NPDC051903]|uniref:thioesterase II family protein n=1 Tax=Amycolatopsis sp. NPDC051903 TaxID=3363936 RepID=UPI003790D81B